MIYDVFLFHGELDILELRLNILGETVDKFVICEAKQAFSGAEWPSSYLANKERFAKWEDKIIYYQFNLMEDQELVEQARNSPNTTGNPYWMKVYYAMEMLRKPLEVCNDEDIVFISDVDEIWNPEIPINADDKVYGLHQVVYYYQLNNRCSEDWTGSIYTTYARLKTEVINNIKQKGELKIEPGGWHFTYQGGEAQMRLKIESSRDETNNDSYYGVPTDYIIGRAQENKDIFPEYFNRGYTFTKDEEGWPDFLKRNREKYEDLCRKT